MQMSGGYGCDPGHDSQGQEDADDPCWELSSDAQHDLSNSFVVNDGVEVGIGSKIPLWLFGFLY